MRLSLFLTCLAIIPFGLSAPTPIPLADVSVVRLMDTRPPSTGPYRDQKLTPRVLDTNVEDDVQRWIYVLGTQSVEALNTKTFKTNAGAIHEIWQQTAETVAAIREIAEDIGIATDQDGEEITDCMEILRLMSSPHYLYRLSDADRTRLNNLIDSLQQTLDDASGASIRRR
ncbi:hypothetical protein FRB99_005246 [Tulasnella sp. 403]|nr:hypothetical protein FRB99_005246 [Tulasnella sp. 403]